jgi:hypothetical protein
MAQFHWLDISGKIDFRRILILNRSLNEAVRLIFSLDAGFNEMKNRKNNDILCLSGWVVPTGQPVFV